MNGSLLSSNFGADETLFLEGAQSLGRNLQLDLLAIDNNSLVLEVWLPDLLGVALRETDIAAVLLALTGDVANLHIINPYNL